MGGQNAMSRKLHEETWDLPDEYKLVAKESELLLYHHIPEVGLLQIAHMETRRTWTVFEQKAWAEDYIRNSMTPTEE